MAKLDDFIKFMNPKGLDISSHSPRILPAVQNNPKNGHIVESFPDIPSSNIIVGGDDTVIYGDVRMGKGNAIMEGCHIRGDGITVTIGNTNNFQNGVTVHGSRARGAEPSFGDFNTLAHGVTWHGAKAGDGCFVAFRSTINDLSNIGNRTVIITNSDIKAGTVLEDGMEYEGRIASPKDHNGKKAADITITDPETGETLPLGTIDERYPKSQARSAQTRRLIISSTLGARNLENGIIQPAYAYSEHIVFQNGGHFLQRSASILFQHDSVEHAGLGKDLLLLNAAIDGIFRGCQIDGKTRDAWDRKEEIIKQATATLNNIAQCVGANGLLIEQKFTGLNRPILKTSDDIIKCGDKLLEFSADISRCEKLIGNRQNRWEKESLDIKGKLQDISGLP